MVVVTLELTSFGTDEIGSVRKIEQADGNSLRLIVTLPRKIDEEQANLTAALLFQNLDRLSDTAVIERVKINGLNFTNTSVVGIQGFLSVHAATVKHVSFKDMMRGTDDPENAEAFETLARVFEVSSLETLNLSDNVICSSLWQHYAFHRNLRQLILDYVEINDTSLTEFAKHFTYGDHLEELYVVLTNGISRIGQAAANQVLRKCKKLSSLRWAERDAPATALLPWNGLMDLARNYMGTRNGFSLVHLVMDGGTIKEEELGEDGLCGAIRCFQKLRTLKLRGIGLGDEGAELLVNSLMHARPPLETLDLGKNNIKTIGSMAIAKLSSDESITKNLVLVAVDNNAIDTGGARTVLERFAKNPNTRLEIKLDGNPFNYGKLAFNLARRKAQAEVEREDMRCASQLSEAGPSTETMQLMEEVRKLRDEKASLLKVLAIVNSVNATNEVERTLDRITKLERTVHGSSVGECAKAFSNNTAPNSLGRMLGRAKSSRDINNDTNGSILSQPYHSPAKKTSPRLGTAHPTPSPTRRSVCSAPNSQQSNPGNRNTLIRGISERWGTPKNGKKKSAACALQQSPSPIGGKYGNKPAAYMPYQTAKIDLDGTNRTNHSNHSGASDSSNNRHSWESSSNNYTTDSR